MRSTGLPLRGALIGCGHVSGFHLEAWSRSRDALIVALCDRDRHRLDRAQARIPESRRYLDAAQLFDQERALEFVEICTPPDTHRELVDLAARSGVQILCQKPAALVRPDLLSMIETCNAAGVRIMIHENWRFRPWYRAMRAEIDSGSIGRPIRLRIAHHDTRAIRPDGFDLQPYLATMPRLILMDMGCHLVDTARYLFGEIRTISATIGRFGQRTVGEDVATLLVSFGSGALGSLDLSWCTAPDRSRLEWALNPTVAEGTEGTLRLSTDGSLELASPRGSRERRHVTLPPDDRVYVEGYAATQRHFIDGLISGTEHETSASDNLKTMDVIWTAYRSAEEGRTLSV
jgi:D-apiose dehydrogenase